MGLLLVGIGIGLLASGVIALVRAISGGGSKTGHAQHSPLVVGVTRSDREPWAVAFRDGAPQLTIDGLEHLGHAEIYRALRERGGVDFGETELRLHLTTHHEDAVVVRGISVAVVRRDPPFTGRLLGVGSTGADEPTALVYDLDADDPGEKAFAFFASNQLTVRRDEPVDVSIVATTTSAYCQWRIHIDAGTGDDFQRMTVDDDGLPFETTGCDRSVFANGFEPLG